MCSRSSTRAFSNETQTAYGFGSLSDPQRRAVLRDTLQKIQRCAPIHNVLSSVASEMEKKSDEQISTQWRLETDGGNIVYYKHIHKETPPITSVRVFLPGVRDPLYAWTPREEFFRAFTTRILLEEVKHHQRSSILN